MPVTASSFSDTMLCGQHVRISVAASQVCLIVSVIAIVVFNKHQMNTIDRSTRINLELFRVRLESETDYDLLKRLIWHQLL